MSTFLSFVGLHNPDISRQVADTIGFYLWQKNTHYASFILSTGSGKANGGIFQSYTNTVGRVKEKFGFYKILSEVFFGGYDILVGEGGLEPP